jgi:hypothetical protein
METFYQFIFILIIIIACIGYLSANCGDHLLEKFETYTFGPYNYKTTGSDPLTFYQYPTYRKPFQYPYQYYSSYPYPYLTYWDNIL